MGLGGLEDSVIRNGAGTLPRAQLATFPTRSHPAACGAAAGAERGRLCGASTRPGHGGALSAAAAGPPEQQQLLEGAWWWWHPHRHSAPVGSRAFRGRAAHAAGRGSACEQPGRRACILLASAFQKPKEMYFFFPLLITVEVCGYEERGSLAVPAVRLCCS